MQTIAFNGCTIQTININYFEKGGVMDEEKEKEIKPGRELGHISYLYDSEVRPEVYKLKTLVGLLDYCDLDEFMVDVEVGQGIARIIEDVTDTLDSFEKELDETHGLQHERMESGVLKDPQGSIGATKEESLVKGVDTIGKTLAWLIEKESPEDKAKAIDTMIAALVAKKAKMDEAPTTTPPSEEAGA